MRFWVPAGLIFLIGVAFLIYWQQYRPVALAPDDSSLVRAQVTEFGQHLKDVLLTGNSVSEDIAQAYGPYVSTELITKWQGDPALAPGQLNPLQLPQDILVDAAVRVNENQYNVSGNIRYVSDKYGQGTEITLLEPIAVVLEKHNNKWLITKLLRTRPLSNELSPVWNTATTVQGFTFKYPEKLSTSYVSTPDWPPVVQITGDSYSCATTSPEVVAVAGVVEERVLGELKYCISSHSEGAAGSTYTAYTYRSEYLNQLISVNFTLRFPQCLNYDNPNQTQCLEEQKNFNPDSLVTGLIQSLQEPDNAS